MSLITFNNQTIGIITSSCRVSRPTQARTVGLATAWIGWTHEPDGTGKGLLQGGGDIGKRAASGTMGFLVLGVWVSAGCWSFGASWFFSTCK
jgi:hypothetical protein